MSEKTNSLSSAEWQVMECLWEESPQTGRQLTEHLEKQMGWNRSTTLTLLRRMEAKGAVGVDTEGSLRTFFPLIRREDAALKETEDFLDRVYHGSLSLMVSALTKKQALSKEELEELSSLLENLEGGR